ncbi:hypothetical protein CLOP_g15931 [Closterium sp. NIES-67]|nr:hypothetical protein CLOP_g15931 [Closterium sp. NIES-67]
MEGGKGGSSGAATAVRAAAAAAVAATAATATFGVMAEAAASSVLPRVCIVGPPAAAVLPPVAAAAAAAASVVVVIAMATAALFTIDLKSGYHHIDIHPAFWRFLGFSLQGQDYQFLSLPFGLATAPFVFTQLIKQLSKRWRRHDIRLIPYINDILFISATGAEALHNRSIIIADLAAARFVVNFKKSQLAPSQSLKFLGLLLDTRTTTFS